MGIRSLHVEVDSQQVFKWMKNRELGRHRLSILIEDYKKLPNRNWSINLDVVFREANRVVDGMAKIGASSNSGSFRNEERLESLY